MKNTSLSFFMFEFFKRKKMRISENGLNLIKRSNPFKMNACLNDSGVPIIGYGSTIYRDTNRKVKLGDSTTEAVAYAMLVQDCNAIAKELQDLIEIDLSQDRIDCLISLCHDIGIGAFQNSTLRQQINVKNFDGATKEIFRWVWGIKNGVNVKFQYKIARRRAEGALFVRNENKTIPIECCDRDKGDVTWIEVHRHDEHTVLAAYNGSKLIELLKIEDSDKKYLIAALNHYPNANNIHIAPLGKTIPTNIPITVFQGYQYKRQLPAPKLHHHLMRGSNDARTDNNDVKELQKRLLELNYYFGEIDGIFGQKTEDAVIRFQKDEIPQSNNPVLGKVDLMTWKFLFSHFELTQQNFSVIGIKDYIVDKGLEDCNAYLKLTKTNRKDKYGCYILNLDYIKNHKVVDRLEVCSGQPKNQYFRKGKDSRSGSYEPLPEGYWGINNIRWAAGKDVYHKATMGHGIGSVTVPIDYLKPGKTARRFIEIHIDFNRTKSYPGTAGCVGIYNIADYKTFVGWLRDTDPKILLVDWGLGSF